MRISARCSGVKPRTITCRREPTSSNPSFSNRLNACRTGVRELPSVLAISVSASTLPVGNFPRMIASRT